MTVADDAGHDPGDEDRRPLIEWVGARADGLDAMHVIRGVERGMRHGSIPPSMTDIGRRLRDELFRVPA